MKMSKSSGKATGAMAAATTTPSPALPKGLNLTDSSLLRTKTPATVSSQATAMLSLPSFQQITSGTGPATSSSSFFAGQQNLMRNTSNGSASGSNYATHSSQQMLLKLISEQRNRDLLALSSKVQPLLPSLQNALSNSASQQHQLLMLARAKQEWQQQQQQQKEATSALRMALMSMQQKQNSHSNAL